MKSDQSPRRSHLFTVRLWEEILGDGRIEYRGTVQHMISGETRRFRDWSTLVEFFQHKLREATQSDNLSSTQGDVADDERDPSEKSSA